MAWLILRDVPDAKVRLDLGLWQRRGGFRGFQNVLPGYHRVALHDDDDGALIAATELFLPDILSVRVLVFAPEEGGFVDDEPGPAQHIAALAQSGQMNRALINAMEDSAVATAWQRATSAVEGPLAGQARSLHPPSAGSRPRFADLWRHHRGDPASTLRESQVPFAQLAVLGAPSAAGRLVDALQAHYHAGEDAISSHFDYFHRFARCIAAMFQLLPALVEPSGGGRFALDLFLEDLEEAAPTDQREALRPLVQTLGAFL